MSPVNLKDLKDLETQTDSAIQKCVKDHGIKIDDASIKEGSVKVNGLDTTTVTLKGTGEDGPCTIMLFIVPVVKGKPAVLLFWWADKEFQKHAEELDKIVDSLKANS